MKSRAASLRVPTRAELRSDIARLAESGVLARGARIRLLSHYLSEALGQKKVSDTPRDDVTGCHAVRGGRTNFPAGSYFPRHFMSITAVAYFGRRE